MLLHLASVANKQLKKKLMKPAELGLTCGGYITYVVDLRCLFGGLLTAWLL